MFPLLALLLPVTLAVTPDNRIVGGEPVDIADYPWQVRIAVQLVTSLLKDYFISVKNRAATDTSPNVAN